ncbi:helix-turn-helix domain-containing protein [Vibrio fluvialis]|uniref:helix-turn-helix domain-containing protein n=1 Tax=Vibrio fluvialis TaxID=676 RepID=UPI00192C7F9D|nr:helix-turn-helix domain-containing protein [Vibrio fluvialis]MBL4293887.1 helix-turn-helix domain-containing protein [Vibrio fluvialis]
MSIPKEYWDWVDNIGGMKGSEKLVLYFLCRKANKNKNYSSWYSVSEMARILCISERSVKNATKALSNMGLITKQSRKDSSSIYTVNLGRIVELGKGNICPYVEDNETANQKELSKTDDCKGIICPAYGQHLPEGGAIFAYKNVIENVIENVNTGETGGRKKVTPENLSDEIIAFWKAIRAHVRDVYQVERFPSRPSQEDIDAMEWAIDEMLPNGVNDNDCRLLCFYVDDELGEPHSVLNPIVRLRLAYDAHEWPEMRFGEKFWQYMEDYQLG